MINMLRVYVITGLLSICRVCMGQDIAVQTNINLIPPYTLSLYDYTQPGSNKLMVTILLKDLNVITHQVRLRFTIEGSGFTLVTKDLYIPPPITLQGGIPEILGSSDLEPYFQPENLNFNGLDKNDYLRTRKLPEGFYRFYVEVLDYNRGSLVSNKAVAIAFIVLNDPPIINLPLNYTKLTANDPQGILFNWAPRHLGSPNSAFTTLYEFRLYDILPKGRDPYEVVRVTKPFYEAIPALTATSFYYNVGMPALIPGNEYAFTVRAIDSQGRDLFKNDGYSEVFKFTWGDECKPPENIKGDSLSGGGIELKWKTAPSNTGYNINYRTSGSSSWNVQTSFIDNASIYDLPGNTVIEYMMQSTCGGYQSDFSKIATIKTMPDVKRNFSCGSGNGLAAINNTNPKKTLKVDDQFTAGGYTVLITKISGKDGIFSGEGKVVIPLFNQARVPHSFENIKINELNQMYDGKLVAIYNPNSIFVLRDAVNNKNPGSGTSGSSDTAIVSKTGIKEVTTTPSGQVLIISQAGDSTFISPAKDQQVTITDNNGNVYKVNNGTVEKTTGSNNTTGGTQVTQNNNTGSSSGTSSGTTTTNTAIGNNHNAGDEVQFGPFKVKFITAPQTDEPSAPNSCTYKVESVLLELAFQDQRVGLYKVNLDKAAIKYTNDCTSGNLLSATIEWTDNTGLPLSGIGVIDALIKKASLTIDNTGKVSGTLFFDALLNQDKSIDQFVYVKSGVKGSFKFDFKATASSLDGSFNMEGISNLNIELRKNNTLMASLSNGSVDNEGRLTGDFNLDKPIIITQNKTRLELNKLNSNATVSLFGDSIIFNSLDGEAKIKDLPGTKADLKITMKDAGKKIVATATSKDNELFKFFGLSMGLEKLTIEFSRTFDIQKIEGTDITAAYGGSNKDGNISGNINIAHFLIANGSISDLKGSGKLAYPPYAEITLEDGQYNQDKSTLSFSANANLSTSATKILTTVKDLSIATDGTITLGEINANLLTTYGPLTIEFKTVPTSGSSSIRTADAKVTIKISDAGVNEKLSFDAKVDYKKTDQGFTYLKTTLSGLNNKFPDIYGVQSIATGISVLYEKKDGNINLAGKVDFTASLVEDKQLNPVLILRKGITGDFAFNFDGTLGTFDLSALKGLKIDLVKGNKAVASLTGSIDKNGIITGRLKGKENIPYESAGLTVTLNSLDLGASYDLRKSEFKIMDGEGKATISDIKGVTGTLVTELAYQNENLNASIENGKSNISVCGMTISDLDLEATIDPEFNVTKIAGNVTAKHPKFNAALKISNFLIQDGGLKSFNINGNIEYSGFKFILTEAGFKDEEFTCSAKVLLSESFLTVDKFVMHKDGEVTIGNCEANITNNLMSIKFKSSLNNDRFTGTFDAKLASKISISGTVDMGTELCASCTNGAFPFGYYQLTVGATIPISPAIAISKLGGQFGYNYAIDFGSKVPKGNPENGKYVAGLSFGIQDNTGMVELAIDPAVFQWGGSTAQLDLVGTLNIPKNSPIIKASAHVKLNIPSYDISGEVNADVKIPSSTGKVFNASGNGQFSLTQQKREVIISDISGKVFNELTFKGNFGHTQNFDQNGISSGYTGSLNGDLSYSLDQSFSTSIKLASITGNFKFNFTAALNTTYNNDGLNSSVINGQITSNGSVDVKVFGESVVSPYYSINASAKLQKQPTNWSLSSSYTFDVGTQSLGTYSLEGSFEHIFE